ncbi:hypothetical protein CDD82_4311 [Ophiocordyceps australis]|uniref:Uncharacterized protein n=1 Tax=Ophiocordyceps australis TaxID=1399860 RepID=A0A2C5Z6U2_9HYPO|nr:hypothetical protein CDD82_4311 [Ophiocordyceps australis]
MAIFPGGKSTRVNSPRHLTIRHSRRLVSISRREARRLAGASALDTDDEDDPLPPGQQKLNSFWAPGLEAGPLYRINVEQTIDAGNKGNLKLDAEQDFYVDAPQFSLPEGSVHSTYPPAGYNDDHRILPHVVLTDPHLPWERLGSPKEGTNKELKAHMKLVAQARSDAKAPRNRVPWLVILSFSQDELRLPPEDLDSIFKGTSSGVIKPVKQSSTMTVNMSIADLWKLTSDVVTPVTQNLVHERNVDDRGDFVLVQSDIFTSLFATYDSSGNRGTSGGPNTSQYKYLAHVRKINGSGMALAGVEDTAVFSIVVGNRSGPLDNVTPTTMCAHLVSIEGVEAMKFPSQSQRYVALCSLHSWNYTVLPPNTLNVPDAFEHLGRTRDVLRAPDAMVKPLRDSSDKIKQLIARRLDDGYTLVKYHTQTGEATVALYRGPLTPTYVPPLENLTKCSNSGVDLQILDKQLGIMDVTYSVAWQVGRTMALGNEAFVAALGRVRTAIHQAAASSAKLQTVKEVDQLGFRTKQDLLEDLAGMVKNLAAIHLGPVSSRRPRDAPLFAPGGARRRWFRSRLRTWQMPKLSFTAPLIQDKYPDEALKAARLLAGSRPGSGGKLYDETNDPQSTDWQVLLAWLLDRMFLAGVPAHCLIADPTYLEPESLRFFRIDSNWIDALIDGALSLGNHWGEDKDRVAIKQAFNDYINSTPEGQSHRVQIPAYGFYLRSDLVTMFPDLRVEVSPDEVALQRAGEDVPSGAPLLRHEIVTDGVMMAFMDRLPGSAQFASLVLTQPAHQQRFAVARGIDTTQLKVDIRRQYTVDQTTREKDKQRHIRLDQIVTAPKDSDNIFVWGSQPNMELNDLRVLRLPRFADRQLQILREKMPTYDDGGTAKLFFDDDAISSALFAMQINDPIYQLIIDLNDHPPGKSSGSIGDLGGEQASVAKSSPPELRTLRQLGTSQIKRLKTSDDDAVPRSEETVDLDADKDVETPTFQRRKGYKPSPTELLLNLAPNVRALTRYTQPPRDPDMPIGYSGTPFVSRAMQQDGSDVNIQPAMAPRYLIRVGSNIVGNRDVVTIDRNNLPQDLIFSIVLEQSEVSQYLLMELAIEIELGPPPQTANESRRFLVQNYTGPGAHMLTNLRFNVLPTITNDANNPTRTLLRLRVLPRSSKGWIQATDVREMGFLLSLASINLPVKSQDEVSIQSYANYCRDPDREFNTTNTMVIQNPDIVVKIEKQ